MKNFQASGEQNINGKTGFFFEILRFFCKSLAFRKGYLEVKIGLLSKVEVSRKLWFKIFI